MEIQEIPFKHKNTFLVKGWLNRLPREVVDFPSLEILKIPVDTVLDNLLC